MLQLSTLEEEDWGWFVHIDEEPSKKNIAYMKRIAIPCTIKEEDDDIDEKINEKVNEKIKKYESDTYLYIGCIVTLLTFIVSKL